MFGLNCVRISPVHELPLAPCLAPCRERKDLVPFPCSLRGKPRANPTTKGPSSIDPLFSLTCRLPISRLHLTGPSIRARVYRRARHQRIDARCARDYFLMKAYLRYLSLARLRYSSPSLQNRLMTMQTIFSRLRVARLISTKIHDRKLYFAYDIFSQAYEREAK